MAPTKIFTITTLLVVFWTGLSVQEPYLVGLSPAFTERDEIVQGWALVGDLCPDGTGGCGKRSCCPVGSWCDDNEATNSNLCCPNRTGCAYDVSQASRCAVATWVEWFTSKDPICCLPGQIGVQPGPNDYYGYCSSAGSNIASSLLASTVSSPSTAAATSTSPSSSSSVPTTSAATSNTVVAVPTTSAASSTSAIASPSTSVGSANSATTSSIQAATTSATPSATASKAAGNVNTSVNRGLGAFLGLLGGLVGLIAI